MREPFPGTMWRKASKDVLPMQCRMSRGNSFMMPVAPSKCGLNDPEVIIFHGLWKVLLGAYGATCGRHVHRKRWGEYLSFAEIVEYNLRMRCGE